jgi:hypothetical protein
MSDAVSAAAKTSENKVRKELVQVFFGLVLTQIAIYITSLVAIWSPSSPAYWAAWSHLILSFALTTASWFGWQMSVKNTIFDEEASVFQMGYILSVLDIILVGLYFILVHQVELTDVGAFPTEKTPKLTEPSSYPETVIILIVFSIYALWDFVSKRVDSKKYGPGPSLGCAFLAAGALAIAFVKGSSNVYSVIFIDLYLFVLIYFFRANKRLQKWVATQHGSFTVENYKKAPSVLWKWTVFWISLLIILLIGIAVVN